MSKSYKELTTDELVRKSRSNFIYAGVMLVLWVWAMLTTGPHGLGNGIAAGFTAGVIIFSCVQAVRCQDEVNRRKKAKEDVS